MEPALHQGPELVVLGDIADATKAMSRGSTPGSSLIRREFEPWYSGPCSVLQFPKSKWWSMLMKPVRSRPLSSCPARNPAKVGNVAEWSPLRKSVRGACRASRRLSTATAWKVRTVSVGYVCRSPVSVTDGAR